MKMMFRAINYKNTTLIIFFFKPGFYLKNSKIKDLEMLKLII